MTDHPRRGRLTPEERLRINLGAIPRFAQGRSRSLHVVDNRNIGGSSLIIGTIALIFHGDDGTAARPAVDFGYWIGEADPGNGADWDWWYTANVDF